MSVPRKHRFIVVDDEPVQLMITKKTIHQLVPESEVETFTEPVKALQFIEEQFTTDGNYAAVLMLDLHMPEMNGLQFLDKFKDQPQTLREQFKIFVLSFTVDEAEIKAAQDHECVRQFYSKPFTRGILHDILNHAGITANAVSRP